MRLGTVLALALAISPAPGMAASEADYERLNASLTDMVALPAVAELARTTGQLASLLEAFCAAPDAGAQAEIDAAFATTMDAWQRLQPLDFGPLMEGDGPARFQYWPDRRGTGTRQLARVLAGADQSVLAPERLAEKSVALGDLQALERLLFDHEAPIGDDAFRCGFALSIATLLAERAAALDGAWRGEDGFARLITTASIGNDAYYNAAEAARDYLDALSHGLERATAQKLRPVLGDDPGSAKPRAVESRRSGRSSANLMANLETLEALVVIEGGFADLGAAQGDPLIGRTIASMLAEARERLDALPVPLAAAVEDPALHSEFMAVAELLESAHALATGVLAGTVGLTAGFNASDGD